jgi:hypothetical protein
MRRLWLLVVLALAGCGSPPAPPAASRSATPGPTPTAIASASTTAIPLGRSATAMAYDAARHNVVLFGGLGGQGLLDDTWTWNGSSWTPHLGMTATPQARKSAAIAYDETRQQVVLFGGISATGQLNDTWAWDGTAWQSLHPAHAPPAREGAPMAYDPALGAIVLFGGMNDAPPKPSSLNDTWQWKGGDWTPLQPAQSPGGGSRPRLAYLSGVNQLERFGDCSESKDRNVYGFDGHTWTPHPPSGTWPPALCRPALAGDGQRHLLVLFGGNSAAQPAAGDTWTYNGTAWSKQAPAQSPPVRDDAAMIYDGDHHLSVLFGGLGLTEGQAGPLNDTWSWDGSNWTLRQ